MKNLNNTSHNDYDSSQNANRKASYRYGWPLFVIENAGDDPKMEQPKAFLETLFKLLQPETVHTN